MEDLKAYIESGILELYVLGQLNATEMSEVAAMAAKHPDILKEIAEIELAMEKYALHNKIDPASSLDLSRFDTVSPAATSDAPKIIPIAAPATKHRVLSYALVACVAMLVISLFALYSAHSRLDEANNQITQLNLEQQKFTRNASFMETQNKELKQLADMPNHPEWKDISLKGMPKSPKSNMTIYWNVNDHQVLVNNSNINLPALDDDHQFQLWAIVPGKGPVDLGIFDGPSQNARLILSMKAIEGAQAFAVTVEKKGGSLVPTMEEMVVMGGA